MNTFMDLEKFKRLLEKAVSNDGLVALQVGMKKPIWLAYVRDLQLMSGERISLKKSFFPAFPISGLTCARLPTLKELEKFAGAAPAITRITAPQVDQDVFVVDSDFKSD